MLQPPIRMMTSTGKKRTFQTPSAGRWVLQLIELATVAILAAKFQTPSAGRWVLQRPHRGCLAFGRLVSNPISGEVGAAATCLYCNADTTDLVSNPISGEVGAAACLYLANDMAWVTGFKPHQRGGGCCSPHSCRKPDLVQCEFQTPSAGRWVLQPNLSLT